MLTHCPECAQPFKATSGHCRGGAFGGCCRSFASTGGFDRHRTGNGEARRCRTDAEMLDLGWTRDGVFWVVPRVEGHRPPHWKAPGSRAEGTQEPSEPDTGTPVGV